MDTNLILLLKQARLARGMKQEEIAAVIGVKKNTISNYENGISEPDMDTFIKMCGVYGVDYTLMLRQAYGGVQWVDPVLERIISAVQSLDETGKQEVERFVQYQQSIHKKQDSGEI